MKIIMVILKLLFLGALFIISNHNLHLIDQGERDLFINVYGEWFDNMVNQGVSVTGYVVKFEWLPKNISIEDNERKFRT
jgi:hypothetical protein